MKNIFKEKKHEVFNKKEEFNFRTNLLVKILIGVVTLVIIILLLPSYKTIDTQYEVGTVWAVEDLIAPFSFPIYKDENVYNAEKTEVLKNVLPVFREADFKSAALKDSVNTSFQNLDVIFAKATALEKSKEGNINSETLETFKKGLNLKLNPDRWDRFFIFYKNELKDYKGISYANYKSTLAQTIFDLARYKIINKPKSEIKSRKISIKRNGEKLQIQDEIDKVYDRQEIISLIGRKFSNLLNYNLLLSVTEEIAGAYIPENLIYDKDLTDLEIQNRVEQIPRTIGIVRENERIVSKHDPITEMTKQKLDSYKKVRLEREGMQGYFLEHVGKILTVLILLAILTLFFVFIRSKVFEDNLKLTLISSLIILECLFSYLSLQINVNAPVEWLIFVPVASILLTIMFDSRLAFFTSVVICFLVAAIRGGDFLIAFVSFAGANLAIFSVRDIKNRSQIFRSFFFILIGYTISILAVGLDRIGDTQKILVHLMYGGINSVMSPIIAYGLLIFFEKVFRITTDLTLLELADFNHPLLKELSTKAPGTFHHSIVMGNLSEAAAEAIGANRILARVGCYYHDVGKILKPEYFVENQLERINRHESLNPNISVKVIISHVKEGIELARKYKIPQEIIDFIPMHHGNTLVAYFYQKAKGRIDENKEDIADYIFRYPGPKPQTKETGIVMLADSIEASTRVIEDPTPKKLEDNIDEVIKKRFIEGELDECELTLKDLTNIKKAFLKILVGIHHQRIKYPEEEKKKN